jgi:2-succinyl-5-enolpyruvyl-6-hydroxy-3-cyclohexene-1-carboxylate synthase
MDFEGSADIYDIEFARTRDREGFRDLYTESVESDGTQVIEVVTDSERSHEAREALQERVLAELS